MSLSVDVGRVNSGGLAISRRASVNWIMLIYFASGACSLIDEVVWVRLLKLTLGNTVYAASIVVSVFMGGLALGALIMSRYSDRVRRRLRLYALLEMLVTISALSLPFMLRLADGVYVWLYRTYHPAHWQLLIVQVVISAAILLVPSMLMGSTLPLLGRFVTSLEKEAGHLVGRLYALNTLGAATGCFLAGFVLIRVVGVMGALYVAAGLNLLVAFGGWFLSRSSPVAAEGQPVAVAVESPEPPKAPDGRFYLLVLAFFMSGLISIGYELLWMRSIVHLLGGVTYVFSAVLTVYLLGNVIGAGIGSRLAVRLKRPAVGFSVTLLLLGLCGIFYLPLLIFWSSNVLPYANRLFDAIHSRFGISSFVTGPLVQSAFLFLVPAIVMGIGFPIALQAWANHMHKVGRSTGTAYGVNTIGAVMGGVVTGFVLIPLLGLQVSISLLGLIGIWIACVMFFLFSRGWDIVVRSSLVALSVILTIYTIKSPLDMFDTVIRSNPEIPDNWELLAVKEGVTTTVSVHRDSQKDNLLLYSSGQSLAGDDYAERGDQKILGHFGILLNKNARKVLSVGFGSGETTRCLAMHKLGAAHCVEIAPEVVDVAMEFFTHLNLGDRLDDEINMIYMDAKNYIHLTDFDYDSIVNDSIHPRDFAENSSLYTKEYFESAKERLRKNKGTFLTWLPTYNVPQSVLASIFGTMLDVFPHLSIWYLTCNPAPLIVAVGSEEPQYFSPRHIENELRDKDVRDSLAVINIYNSVDVLGCYVADEKDLRRHIKNYSINSDYSPFVEFTTDKVTPSAQINKSFLLDVRADSIYSHLDWTGVSSSKRAKWLADYRQLYKASSYVFMVRSNTLNMDKLRYSVKGLSDFGDNRPLLAARAEAEQIFFDYNVDMILAGETGDALTRVGEIINIYPQSASAWLFRSKDMREALIEAHKAVDDAAADSGKLSSLGLMLKKLSDLLIIVDKPMSYDSEKAVEFADLLNELTGYEQAQILDDLSSAYAAAGRYAEAVASSEKALEIAISKGKKDLANSIRSRMSRWKAQHTPK